MAEDLEELQRLRQQVRATVKERTDLEQRLANPDALRSATARAYRDRDAVTNPLLEEARANVAADIAEFHDHWRHLDQIARNVERIARRVLTARTITADRESPRSNARMGAAVGLAKASTASMTALCSSGPMELSLNHSISPASSCSEIA